VNVLFPNNCHVSLNHSEVTEYLHLHLAGREILHFVQNGILYFPSLTMVTPLPPSPFSPGRKDLTRGWEITSPAQFARKTPVPLPWTIRTCVSADRLASSRYFIQHPLDFFGALAQHHQFLRHDLGRRGFDERNIGTGAIAF